MDQLFGDATTAMPTPAQEAEIESLMSASRSPVPSLDIRRSGGGAGGSGAGPGHFTAEHAIPGLDINPPKDTEDGAASAPGGSSTVARDRDAAGGGEGIGGWISRMVSRNRGAGAQERGGAAAGTYHPVGQEDD